MSLTPYANKTEAIKAMLGEAAPFKTGCATCGEPTGNPTDFRDELSMREYKISRMCQDCQDKIFGMKGAGVSHEAAWQFEIDHKMV